MEAENPFEKLFKAMLSLEMRLKTHASIHGGTIRQWELAAEGEQIGTWPSATALQEYFAIKNEFSESHPDLVRWMVKQDKLLDWSAFPQSGPHVPWPLNEIADAS